MTERNDNKSLFEIHTSKKISSHLIIYFIGPLTTLIFILLSYFMYDDYNRNNEEINKQLQKNIETTEGIVKEVISDHSSTLGVAIESIKQQKEIISDFNSKNRENLIKKTFPFFCKLKDNFEITHWYFISNDRVCFLRVHQPERYGDKIERYTTLEAEKTKNTSFGIELGPLGTFTLRYVNPLINNKNQIDGFIEMGLEIDHMIDVLKKQTGMEIYFFISKQYLKQEDWEQGRKMLNRTAEWDLIKDFALTAKTSETKDFKVLDFISRNINNSAKIEIKTLAYDDYTKKLILQPFYDISGKNVGKLISVLDVTENIQSIKKHLYTELIMSAFLMIILISSVYYLFKKLEKKLELSEIELKQLATHDSLTGIYNNRAFHAFLNDEIKRTERTKKPISLCMMDLDNFKLINDTYGHQAGDTILKQFAQLIEAEIRGIDKLCRYGGEEFALILPEIYIDNARLVAERIIDAVGKMKFLIQNNTEINVTVSIGIAVFPDIAKSEDDLLAMADKALYQAKAAGKNRLKVFSKK
ncbi:MAG: diguanylate cyclase [Spirochaetia bacterium]|nr:diguanylate cyclase [Spirochaetia bacterium]